MKKESGSAYIQFFSSPNVDRVAGLPQDLAFLLLRNSSVKAQSRKFRNRILIALCIVILLLFSFSDRIVPGSSTRVITQISNYPNPFDPEERPTKITYQLDQNARVTIIIYDLMGHLVQIFKIEQGDEGGTEGDNEVPWDGTNQAGNLVGRGGYLCRIMVESDQGIVQVIRKIGVYTQ